MKAGKLNVLGAVVFGDFFPSIYLIFGVILTISIIKMYFRIF